MSHTVAPPGTSVTDPGRPDLDARLNALLAECREHERAIYRGVGVQPGQSLGFLASIARLLDGLTGVTSLDTYDDVIEALEDAV